MTRSPQPSPCFIFLCRYDAGLGEVALGFHQDGPLVTCNIPLNSPDDYQGGGTVLAPLQHRAHDEVPQEFVRTVTGDQNGAAIVVPAGHALVHPGHVRHAGAPIQSGVRWVLGLFFDSS